MKSTGFLESIKLAWYVLRYPDRTPVLMVVPKDWCEDNLDLDQQQKGDQHAQANYHDRDILTREEHGQGSIHGLGYSRMANIGAAGSRIFPS